jgi:hypothetical protein
MDRGVERDRGHKEHDLINQLIQEPGSASPINPPIKGGPFIIIFDITPEVVL